MNRFMKSVLLAGAAWSAASSMTMAQDAQSDEQTTVEDIVVTARRSEESVQTVPLAVSAFSGESLERRGAQQVLDLQGAVPNLNIVQGRGSSNATNIYIRGVGQPDALQTFDPAVGVYVDDVYYSRIRGTQFDLLDVERVEVLRGPQGTLYGKNTIGGALKLVSRRPGQEWRGRGSVAYGDYNMIDVQGAVSGPITDQLAFGLSALRSTRDGYVTNPVTGAEYNDKDSTAVRGTLAWDPADNLRIDIIADYSNDDAGLTVGQATNSLVGSSGQTIVAVPSPLPEYNFQTVVDPGLPNSTRLESRGISANIAWDISDSLTLRSITAYRKLNTDDYIDFDATAREVTSALVAVDQDQVSQEFQLNYTSGPISAVGGLYYLKENVDSHQEAYADDLLGALFLNSGFLRTVDDTLETTSKAVYANLTYSVTDQLRLSGGVRYTEEEKDYVRTTSTFFSALPAFNATFPFRPPVAEYDDTSVMLSADYQITPDVLAYARFAQGFKSGGYNGRANSAAEATEYAPETADTYEIGVKTTSMDGRLRLNGTVFQTNYQDFQARVSGLETDPITNLPVAVLSVINAGELKINGAELEMIAQPYPAFTMDAQIGLLNAEYDTFRDARFTAFNGSRAFQTPAFSPKWTVRYGMQYVLDLDGGSNFTFGGAVRYRSSMALAVDNTPVNSDVQLPGVFQDGYLLYDARIVWNDPTDRYSVGVYGQNLSDEVYKTDAQEFSSVGGIRTAYYGAPQTVMVKATVRY
ncbi:TonB-dependent receptor [Brevundimonas subvibrioides]|uniref:TonB-dependent receptor plug n=1 Tax=Brevundimonas subvibrioides (strain ATCC 15264 / DSM 4735 / LMG 14903 / NBRC 16000 / CB 81) TaxID=633149 RepID=D9QKG2_BRESC|nr:TonB-dependent receptor [Brevundimonas subvibrioides]ADK99787.1 TonB-dependent receptor plug [Brevundimonas subvibrioides ATCC 15264]